MGSTPDAALPAPAAARSASWTEAVAERRAERERMVQEQLVARGIQDPRVLSALRTVPRHRFVPSGIRSGAYLDGPLPIPGDQTISQPYVVAFMTELAGIQPAARCLEIGTGSGYQAAVLAELCRETYTIETFAPGAGHRAFARQRVAGVRFVPFLGPHGG